MAQHFLLSAQARTLSLAKVMRLSEDEAFAAFKEVRWAENGGEPVCPRCGSVEAYQYRVRRIFKCKVSLLIIPSGAENLPIRSARR